MTQITGASSSTERPLFRYDLQTTAIQESGKRYVDVSDPTGGASFRFYEVEYAVACGMDGQRDVAGIVRWAMLELELQTTPAEVSAIVAKLAELNYIETGDGVAVAKEPAAAADDSGFELGSSGKAPREVPRPVAAAAGADLELGVAGRSDTVADPKKPSIDSEFELGLAGNESMSAEAAAAAEAAAEAEIAAAAEATAATEAAAAADLAKAEAAAAAAAAAAEETATAAAAAKVISAADLSAEVAAAVTGAEEATPELIAESSDISDSIAEEATAAAKAGQEAIALADSAENEAKREAAAKKAAALAKKRAERRPLVRRTASLVLWLMLLGSVAGAAYYYFFHTEYVLEHPADQPLGLNQPGQQPATPPVPEAPPELAAPSTMTVTEIPTAEALAVRAGTVEWVSDPGSEVAEGDVILKIKGSARAQAALDKETSALGVFQAQLETAEAREDEAKRTAVEAQIAEKQAGVDAASAKLAPFVVKAPISGIVEVLVKARDKVKAEQPIGRITGVAKSVVVFNLSDGVFAEEGQEFRIEAVEDAELSATCTVATMNEQEITLECPSDSGIEADTAVKLSAESE
jgi:hypothetical protein